MESEDSLPSRKSKIAGNILITLIGLMLIGSGVAKLAHVAKVAAELGAMGFDGNKLVLIGVLELFCAALFLLPSTRSVGLLLVSSFLGGAIATHLQHKLPVAQPSIALFLAWAGMWLRHPHILWSVRPGADRTHDLYARAKDVS